MWWSVFIQISTVTLLSASTLQAAVSAAQCRAKIGEIFSNLQSAKLVKDTDILSVALREQSVAESLTLIHSIDVPASEVIEAHSSLMAVATATGNKIHKDSISSTTSGTSAADTVRLRFAIRGSSSSLEAFLRNLKELKASDDSQLVTQSAGALVTQRQIPKPLLISSAPEVIQTRLANRSVMHQINEALSDSKISLMNLLPEGEFVVAIEANQLPIDEDELLSLKLNLQEAFEGNFNSGILALTRKMKDGSIFQLKSAGQTRFFMSLDSFGRIQNSQFNLSPQKNELDDATWALLTELLGEIAKPAIEQIQVPAAPAPSPEETKPAVTPEVQAAPGEIVQLPPVIVVPETKSILEATDPHTTNPTPREDELESTQRISDPNILLALANLRTEAEPSSPNGGGADNFPAPLAPIQGPAKISNLADGGKKAQISLTAFLNDLFAPIKGELKGIADAGQIEVTHNGDIIGIIIHPSILRDPDLVADRLETIRYLGRIPEDQRLSVPIENLSSWLDTEGQLNIKGRNGFESRGVEISSKEIVLVQQTRDRIVAQIFLSAQSLEKPVVVLGGHQKASLIFIPLPKARAKKPDLPSGEKRPIESTTIKLPTPAAQPKIPAPSDQTLKLPIIGLQIATDPDQIINHSGTPALYGNVSIVAADEVIALLTSPFIGKSQDDLSRFINRWARISGREASDAPRVIQNLPVFVSDTGEIAKDQPFQLLRSIQVVPFKARGQVTQSLIQEANHEGKILFILNQENRVAYILWPIKKAPLLPTPPDPIRVVQIHPAEVSAPSLPAKPEPRVLRVVETHELEAAPTTSGLTTAVLEAPPKTSDVEFVQAIDTIKQQLEFATIGELSTSKEALTKAIELAILVLIDSNPSSDLVEAFETFTNELSQIAETDLSSDQPTLPFFLQHFGPEVIGKLSQLISVLKPRFQLSPADIETEKVSPNPSSHNLSKLTIKGGTSNRREMFIKSKYAQKAFSSLSDEDFSRLIDQVEIHMGAFEELIKNSFSQDVAKKLAELTRTMSVINTVRLDGAVNIYYEDAPTKQIILYRISGSKIYVLSIQPKRWINNTKNDRGMIANRWSDLTGGGR